MLRELRRTADALSTDPAAVGKHRPASITRTRAIVQILITVILVPLCLWVLFGPTKHGGTAEHAASVLLGAIVTFWLKD